jgi:DNA-binding transcriptional LysR family regulator
MRREDLGDLLALAAVAEARSFTRAAARLGTSQSALSHTIRRLEARLGIRLLTRTTRNVSPTEAGQRLLEALRPAFEQIESELASLNELRQKPAGTIRITTSEHAASTILWPTLKRFLSQYPDVHVELSLESALTDIVTQRFDAGVRLGEHLARDMVAVRIGPDLRMAVVGSPSYFADRPKPRRPQDLTAHDCINLRQSTLGGLYAWEFEKDRREVNVRVDGSLIFNDMRLVLRAALDGHGLAFVMEDQALPAIADGHLERVLEDWCPQFAGYHLYYPSRRQPTPAFSLLVEALRYNGQTRQRAHRGRPAV